MTTYDDREEMAGGRRDDRDAARVGRGSGALPSWVETMLACPRCYMVGSLRFVETSATCGVCGQTCPTRPHLDLLYGKRPPNEGPGDSAEMVKRRMIWERRVALGENDGVGAGDRAALTAYVEAIAGHLHPDALVVDLGCGTGDVLRRLGRAYDEPLRMLGLDISLPMLDACYRVLRAEPRAVAARASTRRRLPLGDGEVDVVLRRLAPALPDDVARVLRPGGAFLTASFGPGHWSEVYDVLETLPRPRPAPPAPRTLGMSPARSEVTEGRETLSPALVLTRLQAGPAASHVVPARDLPLLYALSERQGAPGQLTLTTEAAVAFSTREGA